MISSLVTANEVDQETRPPSSEERVFAHLSRMAELVVVAMDAPIIPKKPTHPKPPVGEIKKSEQTARWLTDPQKFSVMKHLNTRLNWKFKRSSLGPVLCWPGKPYEAVEKLQEIGWITIESQTQAIRFVLSRKGKFPIMIWWNGKETEVLSIGIDRSPSK